MSDLIERDKVIEYCLKLIDVERKQGSDVMNYGQERINQTDTIIAFVENLPSARPKGEWIDAEIPLECGGSMPIQVCNLCKTFYPLAYTGGGQRFCTNCGAKMDGERKERE